MEYEESDCTLGVSEKQIMWLLEIIAEFIILAIFRYPGAFIIWVLTGFTQPIKQLLEVDMYITGAIGILGIFLVAKMFLDYL